MALLIGAGLAAAPACTAAGLDLGRLFTTAQQRAGMNGSVPRSATAVDSPEDADAQLRLNGVIMGSDGRQAIWVNGRLLAPEAPAVLLHDGRVRLPLAAGSRLLKPGQRLDRSTGRVYEPYEGAGVDAARVEPSPAALAGREEAHDAPE